MSSNNVTTIEPRALVPVSSRIHPIIPQNMEEAWRIAGALVSGQAVPKGVTREQALVAILAGLELGLAPIAAVQRIAVINGRPVIWGDGALGLVRASKLCLWIKEEIKNEGDAHVAVCTTQRKDDPEPVSRTFSVDDAKKADLWQTQAKVTRRGREGTYTADNDSPWFRYPNRMLQMRARAYCLRDVYPDVLGGLYLREEVEEELHSQPRPMPPLPPEEDVPALKTIEHEPAQEQRSEPPPPPEEDENAPPPPEDEEHHLPRDHAREKLIADAMQHGYDERKTFPDLTADAVPPQLRNDREAADAWRQGFHAAGHVEEEPDVVAEFKARASKMEMEEELAVLWQDTVKPQYRELDRETQRALMDAYRTFETALKQNRLAQKYK